MFIGVRLDTAMTSGGNPGALPGKEPSSRDEIVLRFADLYRREKPRLMRFFARKLGSRIEADDMAQETLARFFRSAPHGELVSPEAYLTRIATNMLQDRAAHGATRVALRSVPLEPGLALSDGLDPHREVAAQQEVARWRAILSQLPPLTLEIFSLNRIEGYSYREIATDKGLPLWAIQKHMLKAIRLIAANRDNEHE